MDGVKKRCRPGMGRCQGGFCGPRVQEILARELGKDMSEIVKDGKESYILCGSTKDRITSYNVCYTKLLRFEQFIFFHFIDPQKKR